MVQVVNGHRKEEHLCSECAEKEHVFQKEQSFFGHGFFDSPLDHFFGGSMLGHLLEDPFGTRTLEDQGGGQFIEVRKGTYFEVRKELRRRYPKHYWPENPLEAEAVRGVKRK
mgnify:CR=1 FL=1